MSQTVPTTTASTAEMMWQPTPESLAQSAMKKFVDFLQARYPRHAPQELTELHDYSVNHVEAFWDAVWDFTGIVGEKGKTILKNGDTIPNPQGTGAQFFPDAQLNFAENLLAPWMTADRATDIMMSFESEGTHHRELIAAEVITQVMHLAEFLRSRGVMKGDRVAGVLPNMPETVIAMLATASLGGVWSSASPDFGVQGILDRFGQVQPKVLLGVDHYQYGGKMRDVRDKMEAVVTSLSQNDTPLTTYIAIPFDDPMAETVHGFRMPTAPSSDGGKTEIWSHALRQGAQTMMGKEQQTMRFEPMRFNDPLYIMFSSGTTGAPKCIVHGVGGTLLQHRKEHVLHCDLTAEDTAFYYTTCGWMMWNWLVSALAGGSRLVLYDGSPFAPDWGVLWRLAERENVALFGTAAKYIDALRKEKHSPSKEYDVSSVRVLTSTGSPLVPEAFDYIYKDIKQDLHVASISGGTDIVSCFVLGNPTQPVYRGEIQTAGLGLAVDVWRADGSHADIGEKGELVCTKPFPCMPTGFWGDDDGARYHKAYFSTFDNIWHHGDFAERTAHGGFIIHGRSDTTLNPGGVRIGTAEIYRQVEAIPEVQEAVVVGQEWEDDQRVVLFVVLRDGGNTVSDTLAQEIKTKIRASASPRHVPAVITAVTDIPRTRSGKISEIAVRDAIHGQEVANTEALANPESLEAFRVWGKS